MLLPDADGSKRQASAPPADAAAATQKGHTKPAAAPLEGRSPPKAATPTANPPCLAITAIADAMPLASGGASARTISQLSTWSIPEL